MFYDLGRYTLSQRNEYSKLKVESKDGSVVPSQIKEAIIFNYEEQLNHPDKFYEIKDNLLYNSRNNPLLEYAFIPSGITEIDNFAFSNNERSLKAVVIPEGVKCISNGAFYYCRNLQSVVIPDSVVNIGREAFYYCINLKTVTIPKNVAHIGLNAFYCVPKIINNGTALGAAWGALSME